ncbi:histidine phosphatase family protein [Actinomyces oricola]|uniref:histidine phosphatase family protein n=1 Tax=Actinomyces oricola TaxID=206043 RepID=UPI003BAAE6D8
MARTTIHLMRHGEVHNPEGVLYGRLPGYHLSGLGNQMAARVADVLAASGHDIAAVITSPLERARESGAPTAEVFNLEASTDARLIEADNHFEGIPLNRNRWLLAHPGHWSYYRNPLRPSWGEPYTELVARMRDAVASAIRQAEGREALLVSHQLPVWALRLWLEGRWLAHDPRRRQCSLASLTSLTFEGRTLVGLAYWEPAGDLLRSAEDMVPGTSAATVTMGRAGALKEEPPPAPVAQAAAPAGPASPAEQASPAGRADEPGPDSQAGLQAGAGRAETPA